VLGEAIVQLAGSPEKLCADAVAAAAAGNIALATSLIEFAFHGAPSSLTVAATRKQILESRADAEPSLMARNIYAAAARDCDEILRSKL
jgi:hypothetical protein